MQAISSFPSCRSDLQTALHSDISDSTCKNKPTILDGIFFEKIENKSSGDRIVAKCTKCNSEVKASNNCTSNLVTHLKRKHGINYLEEYRAYLKESKKQRKSSSVSEQSSQNVYLQDHFDKDVVNYFIDSMISLRSIDNVYFHKIIKNINSCSKSFNIMSRRALGRKIAIYYNEQVEIIKRELEDIEFVCITTDIWSGRRRSFLGVTAHWIHPETLKRISRAIACQRFKGTHSYDKIYDHLMNIYKKVELNSAKVIAAITDNGGNFVKAFKIFGIEEKCILEYAGDLDTQYNSWSTECDSDTTSSIDDDVEDVIDLNECLPLHFRCASHTLSLCATTDSNKILEGQDTEISKIHEQVMKKCNIFWRAACRPKSSEIIISILGHTLSRPNETRWNSLFDAMKQFLSIKEKSAILSKELNLKTSFKDQDFTYIEEYVNCSKHIAAALDILQGEKETYFGILFPTLLSLRHKLQKSLTEDFIYCRPLAEAYLESIENRFSQYFDISSRQAEIAVIATLCHPIFLKFKWLSCISDSAYTKIKMLFITELTKEIKSSESLDIMSSVNSEERDNFYFIDSDQEETKQDPKKKAELLYAHFCLEENKDLSVLNSYKAIKNMFIKYNTALPSSASVERLFSFATITNYCKANRLSDEMFEKRVVLKANLKYNK